MKEIKKDLFECVHDEDVDGICVTTNANYTVGGLACMGGGCAGEAARRWPKVARRLGTMLKLSGSNIPFVIGALDEDGNHLDLNPIMIKSKEYKCLVFSFPTINNLGDGSNLQLIKQSSTIMVDHANQFGLKKVILPRPGVGIGGLEWKDVKPEIESILDDRFTIVSFDHEE
jgi:O-acetyl-ADP-ribose deacetylase (regulator of RNase III)